MQNFNYFCVDKYALTDKVNNFSMTYKHLDSCQNMKVLVKYVMNTAPPLLVVAVEALHHHITALSVGIHRVLSVPPYFFSLKVIKYKYSKIKKMKENILYEPPMVEVIEVEVECGFAISGHGSDSDDSEFGN